MRLPAILMCLWCAVLLTSAAAPIVPQPAAPGSQYVTDPAGAQVAAEGQAATTVKTYEDMAATAGWLAMLLGGTMTAVKLAAAVPGPWQAAAQIANHLLPGLAGLASRKRALSAQADMQSAIIEAMRKEQVSMGLVSSVHQVLNVLPKEWRGQAVRVLKAAQEDENVREEVRVLIGRMGLPRISEDA